MDIVEIKKGALVTVAEREPFVAPYNMVIISATKCKQDEALLKSATKQWSER
jgi:hypothetical protein